MSMGSVIVRGSTLYYATDSAGRVLNQSGLSGAPASTYTDVTLELRAGDPEYRLEVQSDTLASGIAVATVTAIARYALQTLPLAWDSAYYDITRIGDYPYLYVRNVNYRNWRHNASDWYACALDSVEIKHEHKSGTKSVSLTILITRQ
jgi:hypothetical protein